MYTLLNIWMIYVLRPGKTNGTVNLLIEVLMLLFVLSCQLHCSISLKFLITSVVGSQGKGPFSSLECKEVAQSSWSVAGQSGD